EVPGVEPAVDPHPSIQIVPARPHLDPHTHPRAFCGTLRSLPRLPPGTGPLRTEQVLIPACPRVSGQQDRLPDRLPSLKNSLIPIAVYRRMSLDLIGHRVHTPNLLRHLTAGGSTSRSGRSNGPAAGTSCSATPGRPEPVECDPPVVTPTCSSCDCPARKRHPSARPTPGTPSSRRRSPGQTPSCSEGPRSPSAHPARQDHGSRRPRPRPACCATVSW